MITESFKFEVFTLGFEPDLTFCCLSQDSYTLITNFSKNYRPTFMTNQKMTHVK